MISFPPINAHTISIRSANIVPPTSAIGPKTVLAVAKIATMVKMRVKVVATSPVGGQNGCVTRFVCKVVFVIFRALVIWVESFFLAAAFCSMFVCMFCNSTSASFDFGSDASSAYSGGL